MAVRKKQNEKNPWRGWNVWRWFAPGAALLAGALFLDRFQTLFLWLVATSAFFIFVFWGLHLRSPGSLALGLAWWAADPATAMVAGSWRSLFGFVCSVGVSVALCSLKGIFFRRIFFSACFVAALTVFPGAVFWPIAAIFLRPKSGKKKQGAAEKKHKPVWVSLGILVSLLGMSWAWRLLEKADLLWDEYLTGFWIFLTSGYFYAFLLLAALAWYAGGRKGEQAVFSIPFLTLLAWPLVQASSPESSALTRCLVYGPALWGLWVFREELMDDSWHGRAVGWALGAALLLGILESREGLLRGFPALR